MFLMLEQEIHQAYEDLMTMMQKAHLAGSNLTDAKIVHSTDRQSVLLSMSDPKELGSNEAQRDATIDKRCAPSKQRVIEAETAARVANYNVEIARLKVDQARCRLRVAEIASAVDRERR